MPCSHGGIGAGHAGPRVDDFHRRYPTDSAQPLLWSWLSQRGGCRAHPGAKGSSAFAFMVFDQKRGFRHVFPGSAGDARGRADPPAGSVPAPLRRAAGSEAGRDRHGGHAWMASSHGDTRPSRGANSAPRPSGTGDPAGTPSYPVPGIPRTVPAPALLAGLHAAIPGRQHAWGDPQPAKAARSPGMDFANALAAGTLGGLGHPGRYF